MNNTILQKCLKELGEATPRLDYVRGMLETLIELSHATSITKTTIEYPKAPITESPKTEAQILDEITKARLAGVKAASHVELG